jgi:penicillin-binding protein 1A
MQMATAYAVFANGGHGQPWLVARISDQKGKTLVEIKPPVLNASTQAIDARNAFIMSRLLQEVTRAGTAAKARALLKRPDLYGKTGTTNDSIDTWFAGYQPTLAAVVWMGTTRLVRSATARRRRPQPAGLDQFHGDSPEGSDRGQSAGRRGDSGGEWYFDEFAHGTGVSNLGLDDRNAKPGTSNTQSGSATSRRTQAHPRSVQELITI